MSFLLANTTRPTEGPIYSDEYIERWASVYLANPALRLLGCPFSRFLAGPQWWLRFVSNPLRHPADVARVVADAERAVAQAERVEGHGANGRLVEKIKHHKHPRSSRDFVPLRQG